MRWCNRTTSIWIQLRLNVEVSFGWQGLGIVLNPTEYGLTLFMPFVTTEILMYRSDKQPYQPTTDEVNT
jgi:hypothetical protein